MDCTCLGWKQNIGKLNASFVLQSARSGGKNQYNGKEFEFCPWCGKNLHDKPKDNPQKDHGMIDSIKINGVDFTIEECRKLYLELKEMFNIDSNFVKIKPNSPIDTKPISPTPLPHPPPIVPTYPPYEPSTPRQPSPMYPNPNIIWCGDTKNPNYWYEK